MSGGGKYRAKLGIVDLGFANRIEPKSKEKNK